MIMQKFLPIKVLAAVILETIDNDDYKHFRKAMGDISFPQIDKDLFSIEDEMFKAFDKLSSFTKEEQVVAYVQSFTTIQKYFIENCFQIAFYYPVPHEQYLPLFPMEKLYFNFFAYLQFSYDQFKKYCIDNELSFMDQVYELGADLL